MLDIVLDVNSDGSSNTARVVLGCIGSVLVTCLVLLAVVWLASPRFNSRMEEWTGGAHTVPATVNHCELFRNGDARENEVRCNATYSFEGKPYAFQSRAWSSDSPFLTSAGLADELTAQSQITVRSVHVHRYAPDRGELVDERWIAMPPFGTLLGVLFIACMATYVASIKTVYKRSEFTETGSYKQQGKRVMLQIVALSCAGLFCIYALTNRPTNVLNRMSLTALQQVPAHLTDCTHRFHGASRGNDEINCAFQYLVQGKTYTGRADEMDFRFFPTDARMDAEVTRTQQTPDRIAYVDPQHPTFAMTYISNDWFVLYSWGLFELAMVVIAFGVIPVLIKQTISSGN